MSRLENQILADQDDIDRVAALRVEVLVTFAPRLIANDIIFGFRIRNWMQRRHSESRLLGRHVRHRSDLDVLCPSPSIRRGGKPDDEWTPVVQRGNIPQESSHGVEVQDALGWHQSGRRDASQLAQICRSYIKLQGLTMPHRNVWD